MRRRVLVLAANTLVLAAVSGCAAPADPALPTAGETITVFAAASLTQGFTTLASSFESAHPGTGIVLNFAGSAALVTQILEGAPADVFASADAANMAKLTEGGLADGDPVDFATNTLEIVVPPGNPARISTFADLAGPSVRLVVCAPEVPCGAATIAVATRAGVTLAPVSEESSVTDVLGKVTSGEADAGLVYVTDVRSAGDSVTGITFAESASAVNTYPIAAVADRASARLSHDFIAYVTSPEGQSVLRAAGFGSP